MKSKLLLACTILFFCSSFLCGQNQTSKVANSAETNNGAVRHPWQGKRVGYLGDSITHPNCYGDKIKKGNHIQSYSLKPLKGCKFSN